MARVTATTIHPHEPAVPSWRCSTSIRSANPGIAAWRRVGNDSGRKNHAKRLMPTVGPGLSIEEEVEKEGRGQPP